MRILCTLVLAVTSICFGKSQLSLVVMGEVPVPLTDQVGRQFQAETRIMEYREISVWDYQDWGNFPKVLDIHMALCNSEMDTLRTEIEVRLSAKVGDLFNEYQDSTSSLHEIELSLEADKSILVLPPGNFEVIKIAQFNFEEFIDRQFNGDRWPYWIIVTCTAKSEQGQLEVSRSIELIPQL